jgi:hypothetical protein
MIPQLIILDISSPPPPIKSSLSHNNNHDAIVNNNNKRPMVRFSKVMIVNNVKTVYLCKIINQSPGTTKNNVNRRFITATTTTPHQQQQ